MPAELLNAEAIIGSYLRGHADVKAMEARVLGDPPDEGNRDKPWVMVTQQDPRNITPTSRVEHLVAYWLQLDIYSGAPDPASTDPTGQGEARKLNALVRAALVALPSATLEGAVVTAVDFLSNPRIPDTDMEPARQRYVLDAEVTMHG